MSRKFSGKNLQIGSKIRFFKFTGNDMFFMFWMKLHQPKID